MIEDLLESGLLVQRGLEARKHYELAHINFETESGQVAINIIPIALVDGQLLVAAPHRAWHKTPSERLLPRGALVKVVLVEVQAANTEQPEEPAADHPGLKLWVGFLASRLRAKLVLGGASNPEADVWIEEDTEDGEVETYMPFGPALAALADEHFAFLSALSGEGAGDGKDLWENRMDRLEESFKTMQRQLEKLVQKEVGGPAAAAGDLGARAKAGAAKPKIIGKDRTSHLDPAVLASAREAGIQEEQLQDLGRILKKDNKLADLPGLRGRKNELSETEEEDELMEDVDAEAGGEPIHKAVIQLTKIVGSLAKPKKSGIEALMEGLDSVADSSSGSAGGRTKAAAYKKLRSSLVEQPKYVFQTVEDLMDQDFAQVRSGPGLASVSTSSRAWLEHRSRLQNFPNTVRLAWQIAGAHDALRAGNTNECRARLSLLLVALDQAAVDSGAWTLAQEILLEHAPPYQAFTGKKAPELWEQSSSKILDDRWLDVLMWKIKDRDAYLEARRRLGPSGKAPPVGGGKGDGPPVKDPAPKRGQKGAKGAKGEEKGGPAREESQA